MQLAQPGRGAGVHVRARPPCRARSIGSGFGAASTAAHTRRLKKCTLAKNSRSENRYTTTPGVTPTSGSLLTSAYRSSAGDQPSTASFGRAIRRITSSSDSTTATTNAMSTPRLITATAVITAITELGALAAAERPPLVRVDQADCPGHDDRGERGGRQVLDRFGQQDEDHEDEAGRDEPADLAGGAHARGSPRCANLPCPPASPGSRRRPRSPR